MHVLENRLDSPIVASHGTPLKAAARTRQHWREQSSDNQPSRSPRRPDYHKGPRSALWRHQYTLDMYLIW